MDRLTGIVDEILKEAETEAEGPRNQAERDSDNTEIERLMNECMKVTEDQFENIASWEPELPNYAFKTLRSMFWLLNDKFSFIENRLHILTAITRDNPAEMFDEVIVDALAVKRRVQFNGSKLVVGWWCVSM